MAHYTYEQDGQTKEVYIDGNLLRQLETHVIPAVQKKDFDYVIALDGEEGTGKSVFAMQLAKALDRNFNMSKVVFTPHEFVSAVTTAEKFSCIVFDEAFTGLSSRSSLSEINQLLVSMMMEMRQRNLFVIIVMPTIYMMDRYCVLHRARGLFHVYLHNGKRGYWSFFSKRRMMQLYLNGKKTYGYGHTKPIFFGRFLDNYVVNEEVYRKKKWEALQQKDRKTEKDKYLEQRDYAWFLLNKVMKRTQTQMSEDYKVMGFSIATQTISDAVARVLDTANDKHINLPKGGPLG